jgi:ABC-2 type transport system ATP-binding protein
MKAIIQSQNLSKSYKGFLAVSENNISVGKGEIYGFLGLNGAGKTTLIRMLLGLIKPSSGKAFLNGMDISKHQPLFWNRVGYLVEVPHAYPNLTVKENLELICHLRRIDKNKSIDPIIELLDLKDYTNRLSKQLSLGNKQRLGLAKALIHQPEILILDEPTNGLDPAGIHDIRELLIDLSQNKGVSILVSSHILGEISHFAHRIGIIHKGRMIDEFNTNNLNELCKKQLLVNTDNNEQAIKLLHQKGFSAEISMENEILIHESKVILNPEGIAQMIVSENLKLKKLNMEEENLESYFLRIIKEKEV